MYILQNFIFFFRNSYLWNLLWGSLPHGQGQRLLWCGMMLVRPITSGCGLAAPTFVSRSPNSEQLKEKVRWRRAQADAGVIPPCLFSFGVMG